MQHIFQTKEGDDETFCPKILQKASTFLDIFTISAAPKMGRQYWREKREISGKIGSFLKCRHMGPLKRLHQEVLLGCMKDKILEIFHKFAKDKQKKVRVQDDWM